MPFYEITLIPRPLAKAELVKAIHRAVSVLLEKGAVVTSFENLGYKDLPYRRHSKAPVEKVFTSNYFLVGSHMPVKAKEESQEIYQNDLNLVTASFVDCSLSIKFPEMPSECKLEELLKVPAKRKSVEELRTNQKMAHYSRERLYKRMEREYRKIPKSYYIPPQRF